MKDSEMYKAIENRLPISHKIHFSVAPSPLGLMKPEDLASDIINAVGAALWAEKGGVTHGT